MRGWIWFWQNIKRSRLAEVDSRRGRQVVENVWMWSSRDNLEVKVDLGRLDRAEQGAFAKTKGSLPTETNHKHRRPLLLFYSSGPAILYSSMRDTA